MATTKETKKKATAKTTAKKTEPKATAKKAEAKKEPAKKTAAKKTTKVEWRDGYPNKNGLFLCKLDGEEVILRHTVCTINGKHKWATIDNRLPLGKELLWSGDPLGIEELDAFLAKKK